MNSNPTKPDPKRWQQVQQIFHEVLSNDPPVQDEKLKELCQGDSDLIQQVNQLLVAHNEAGEVLEGVVGHVASKTIDDKPGPEISKTIGNYRILELLGRGGMGVVYLAQHCDPQIANQVAIKLIQHTFPQPELIRRFISERRILARLDHPNIARLVDGGNTAEGNPYLVMEYVRGDPIYQYCDRMGLSIKRRLLLFQQVCQAVQYLHQNLIIHRDLKPSNILVTEDGVPKLLDFGIAKLLTQDNEQEQAPMTRTGFSVMTPRYASPEQVAGAPITVASDVFTLGVLLYELLTGLRPYSLGQNRNSDIENAVRNSIPARPSQAVTSSSSIQPVFEQQSLNSICQCRSIPLDRFSKELSGDIDTIVLTAMHKDVEHRYGSADKLANDINLYLNGLPVTAQRDSFTYRFGKFIHRHRLGVSATLSVVILITAVVSFYTHQLMIERDRATVAEQQAEKESLVAQQEAKKANEVVAFLKGVFQVANPSESRGKTITAKDILEGGKDKIDRDLVDQPELHSTLLGVIAEVYRNLGMYSQSVEIFRESHQIGIENWGPEDPRTIILGNDLALALMAQGQEREAEPLIRKALENEIKENGEINQFVSTQYNNLAWILKVQGKLEAAEQAIRKSIHIDRATQGQQRLAQHLYSLGKILIDRGRYAEAKMAFEESLSIRIALFETPHPLITESLYGLAQVSYALGHYQSAEIQFKKIIKQDQAMLGNEHAYVAADLYNLARLYFEAQRYEQSRLLLEQCIAIQEPAYAGDHYYLADSYGLKALLLFALGESQQAVGYAQRAIAMKERIFGMEHKEVNRIKGTLASVWLIKGRLQEAKVYLQDLLHRRTQGDHWNTRETALLLNVDAQLNWKLGSEKKALQQFSEAIKIAREKYSKSHPQLAAMLVKSAALNCEVGQTDTADRLIQEALQIYRTQSAILDRPLTQANLILADCEKQKL